MKTRVDARLLDEAARFAFRFSCDHCGHFDAGRQRCSLGYPAEPRLAQVPAVVGGNDVQTLELCKEFELG